MLRWLVLTGGFLLIMTGVIVGNFAQNQMLTEVNQRIEPSQRFNPLGWYLQKSQRLWTEHKRLGLSPKYRQRSISALMAGCAGFMVLMSMLLGIFVGAGTR